MFVTCNSRAAESASRGGSGRQDVSTNIPTVNTTLSSLRTRQ